MNKQMINYFIDVLMAFFLFISAVTGLIIFFFLPSGVKQGRYQEFMGIIKETWAFAHSWAGIIIMILVMIHLILHWNWIICMTKSFLNAIKRKRTKTNKN